MTIGVPPSVTTYPFALLDAAKAEARAAGIDVIDLGVGDPLEPTPALIRTALAAAIIEVSQYPRASGLEELRVAIARWMQRRFGRSVDPATSILPTLGSKEIIHSLPGYVLSPERTAVVVPTPSYPVYERGAQFHGGDVVPLPLRPELDFLPDLDAVPDEVWHRTALLWINYPNNPTGFTAPMWFYEHAHALAMEHGFVLASDEAYSEIAFGHPVRSALELSDHRNLLVVNTLSKRSCMTGYRSGFVAGDAAIIDRIRRYRPSVGVTPQEFVQRASVAAWDDETHVVELHERWRAKREVMRSALQGVGLHTANDATFFLWVAVPAGMTSESFAAHLLSVGVAVTPGTFFGEGGEGYVRMALVPPLDDCRAAASRISELLTNGRP